ncbi:hypothetical protein SASPL_151784 [Salvia splendens]|uniref:Protein kinase domain-containing protein n=1 Tax=Salvia splendens TaxID=180675 RepID=A0A8X8W220_SALSN|nr:hypothetical protein SASPL_151784 [Salvia splendens]
MSIKRLSLTRNKPFSRLYMGIKRTLNGIRAMGKEEYLCDSALMEMDVFKSLPRLVMEYVESDLKKAREKGFVHRDLKPANILFGGKNRVKICDFGLSARLESLWGGGVGTMFYKAPEILDDSDAYTSGVDVWSMGCMMAEFVLDKPLFRGRSDGQQLKCIRRLVCGQTNLVRMYIMSKSASLLGSTRLSESGLDLLKKLLAFDPSDRISARDALNHPWLEEFED